jgi:hypothetical protein
MPAILRERHLYPVSTPVTFRREESFGKVQWLHPLAQMYATVPADQTPAQRTGLLVLAIATPVLALLILLFVLTFRRHTKQREARERGFQISDPQVIPEPAKTYMTPHMGFDMGKVPPVMGMVDERPIITMPEPQVYRRPGGTTIGSLPSLEVTPPSEPNSKAGTPNTPRTLQVPRSPGYTTPRSPRTPGFTTPRSPHSPRGHYHHGVPPGTPFGDVSDQPLSANSLERMMTRMESDLRSPVPSPRRF